MIRWLLFAAVIVTAVRSVSLWILIPLAVVFVAWQALRILARVAERRVEDMEREPDPPVPAPRIYRVK